MLVTTLQVGEDKPTQPTNRETNTQVHVVGTIFQAANEGIFF
jgi:hypothetical protein